MEPEEMAKNVDACYKNILEKFNPGARQLINAGKSYLKALHGAAAAAKIYLESLSRVAKQAQQGTCGGTADIGIAMQQMIDVQREIQSQQLNTLKAFYVDLIVPLESNIEKDTKVVQADHKKFNQQYRSQYDVYSKALGLVKKHSKKSSSKLNRSSASYDKEIKHLQTMEEEKAKLDAFCEQSLKEAIGQERKRYGFVLERQTSLSKHFLAHYGKGAALLEKHLDGWQETSKAREELPACVEFLLDQQNGSGNENLYALPRTPVLTLEDETDNFCSASQMRKSHSIDTSYLYEEAQSTFTEAVNPKISGNQGAAADVARNHGGTGSNLCKSKSEYNLAFASPTRSVRSGFGTTSRPKSLALPGSTKGTVRALYAYLSSGEHQINFLEGDLILLLGDEPVSFHSNANGDRNKGWYYGENVRTGKRGWFPLAYTEQVKDADVDSGLGLRSQFDSSVIASPVVATNNVDAESTTSGNSSASNSSSSGTPHTMPTSVGTLKAPCTRKAQAKLMQQQQQQQQQNTATLRPNSLLLGDRAIFNKVPGFSKLRKSRSAFAERLLCPAATPSAPGSTPSAPVPAAEYGSAATGPAAASPSTLMMLPLSHSSSTSRVLSTSSATSSPSCSIAASSSSAVFSPTKKAPAPPPRLQTTAHPPGHPHSLGPGSSSSSSSSHPLLGMTNAADLSLRSSSDSGFVNEPLQQQTLSQTLATQEPSPPPAPEVDYSDEESLKFQPNLSHWLLYSSALDVSQDMYSADWGHGSKRLSDGLKAGNEGLSMTLDRPPKTTGTGTQRSSPVRTKLSSYPPVLGYLATLTRSKASKQLRRQNVVVIDDNGDNGAFKDARENNVSGTTTTTTPADQLLADRSGAVRRLSGLFTKHSATTGQRESPATMTAAKIKNKLSAAPGILKTALFRSRSKDSFLDSSFQESTSAAAEAAPWQHKSSVPCYVGWRPPMPLPKDCPVTDPAPRSSTVRRVARTESRRSNLGWRKYSSESDLLDASESGYMAIDRVPVLPSAWPPTLALLTPIFGRFEGDGSSYSRADNNSSSGPSTMPHTLPRKFQSDWLHASSPSLRVQFNLEQQQQHDESPLKKAQTAAGAAATPAAGARATNEARQVKAEFEEYSLRLKQRLKLAEGSSHCNQLDRLSDESGDQRCGPWYDLWTPDPSVRLCEIAQL